MATLKHDLRSDPPALDEPSCWRAVLARDNAADGLFYYAVATTGVFCRPGCGARRPRRENVRFFASADAARRAGFRPCKRCKPDAPESSGDGVVARACAILSAADEQPNLAQLSAAIGLSPYHFHRRFKAALGVTPKAYADAVRARRLCHSLRSAGSVSDALYAAGYGSSSRFYDIAEARLGMKPKSYRTGGAGIEIRYATGHCSLGAVVVAATDRGICAIELGDDSAEALASLAARFPKARLAKAGKDLAQIVARAIAAVEQPEAAAALPLAVQGTAFQEQVWRTLRAIPAGETVTYAEIARRLGRPSATRAVATAIAANPIAVVVPCHRVVRTDNGLGGYRWGLDRKQRLLDRERAAASRKK